MPKYEVLLNQWVLQQSVREVEAANPSHAKAIALAKQLEGDWQVTKAKEATIGKVKKQNDQ